MRERLFRTLTFLVAFGLVGVWALSGTHFLRETHPIAPPTDTFLCFGVPSSLLVAGTILLEKGQVIALACWSFGQCQYSIYLSHYLIVGAIGAALNRVKPAIPAAWRQACTSPFSASASSHRLFEDPVQRRLRAMLGASPPPRRRSRNSIKRTEQ